MKKKEFKKKTELFAFFVFSQVLTRGGTAEVLTAEGWNSFAEHRRTLWLSQRKRELLEEALYLGSFS